MKRGACEAWSVKREAAAPRFTLHAPRPTRLSSDTTRDGLITDQADESMDELGLEMTAGTLLKSLQRVRDAHGRPVARSVVRAS